MVDQLPNGQVETDGVDGRESDLMESLPDSQTGTKITSESGEQGDSPQLQSVTEDNSQEMEGVYDDYYNQHPALGTFHNENTIGFYQSQGLGGLFYPTPPPVPPLQALTHFYPVSFAGVPNAEHLQQTTIFTPAYYARSMWNHCYHLVPYPLYYDTFYLASLRQGIDAMNLTAQIYSPGTTTVYGQTLVDPNVYGWGSANWSAMDTGDYPQVPTGVANGEVLNEPRVEQMLPQDEQRLFGQADQVEEEEEDEDFSNQTWLMAEEIIIEHFAPHEENRLVYEVFDEDEDVFEYDVDDEDEVEDEGDDYNEEDDEGEDEDGERVYYGFYEYGGNWLHEADRHAQALVNRERIIECSTTSMTYTPPEDGEKEQCAICLEEYVVDDSLRALLCEHKFHVSCIDVWFLYQPNCPVCRRAC